MTDTRPTIHELLPRVAAEIGVVGKASENRSQGYSFRGIDDVVAAVSPILSAHGVTFIPTGVEDVRDATVPTKSGGQMRVVSFTQRFRFYAPDGSYVEGAVRGEGMDSGDKGSNKATSAAAKYALTLSLLIPTKGSLDEGDFDSPTYEPTNPRVAEVKQRIVTELRGTPGIDSVPSTRYTEVYETTVDELDLDDDLGDATDEQLDRLVELVVDRLDLEARTYAETDDDIGVGGGYA